MGGQIIRDYPVERRHSEEDVATMGVGRRPVVRHVEAVSALGDTLGAGRDIRCAVLVGRAASGLSFFLDSLENQLAGLEAEIFHVSPHDQSANAGFNQLFAQLLSIPRHRRAFSDFIVSRGGSGQLENILRSLAVCIPVVGSAFGVIEHQGDRQVQALRNEIDVLNLGAQYIATESATRPMVICVDASGCDEVPLKGLLQTFASDAFSGVKFVIGCRQGAGRESLTIDRITFFLESLAYKVRQIDFPSPSAAFVSSLYSAHGLSIQPKDAESILAKYDGDIYQIMRGIHALQKSSDIGDVILAELRGEPTPVEKKVIGFLAIAEQALPESELVELLLRSEDIFLEDAYQVRACVDRLHQLGVITLYDQTYDRLVSLREISKPGLIAADRSRVDYLLLSRQMFDFYVERFGDGRSPSNLRYAPLLYRLSAICDQDRRPDFGQSVLRYSLLMQNFSDVEARLQSVSVSSERDGFDTFLISLLYHVANKEYARALSLIVDTDHHRWIGAHPVQLLEAICHNRLRNHPRAEALLRLASQGARSIEESVIINGYAIANYLHWGKTQEARTYFEQSRDACASAANYAYMLRNAAAAYDRQSKLEMEFQAAQLFAEKSNHYGEHSSIANAGATLMALDNYVEAARLFDSARRGLQGYGLQHSVIIAFNSMAVALMRGELKEGAGLMARFKQLPDHNLGMTEMYTLFYEGVLALLGGDRPATLAAVARLVEKLDETQMPRARERLYPNAAVLGMAAGMDISGVKPLLQKSGEWPDSRDPITTQRVLDFGEAWIETPDAIDRDLAIELICPPYFAYWYMDEISLLSRAWLAP